jgi:hypothetical protein
MWDAHAEVPKKLLQKAAHALEELYDMAKHYQAQRDEERAQPMKSADSGAVLRVVDPGTLATHSEIADAVRGIEKERRNAMRELMRDFDEGYYCPNLKAMREACGRLGHKWRFTHLGPLRDPWFGCGVCHAMECRPERESA